MRLHLAADVVLRVEPLGEDCRAAAPQHGGVAALSKGWPQSNNARAMGRVGFGRIVVSEIEIPNLLEIWYEVDERYYKVTNVTEPYGKGSPRAHKEHRLSGAAAPAPTVPAL